MARTLRNRFFSFYWSARSRITPGLEDSQTVYERTIEELLRTRSRWLDLGCGHKMLPDWRETAERQLVSSADQVVGVDYEHNALVKHRSIRQRVRADIEVLPFVSDTFDLVTANMVLEHVAAPERLLKEIFRVLKPGGAFLGHTPNVHGYITVLARLIPEGLKPRLVGFLQNRAPEDVFTTHYRINSEEAFARLGRNVGFAKIGVQSLASEAQLMMIPPLVVVELLGIRALMSPRLQRFRPYLIAVLEKSHSSPASV